MRKFLVFSILAGMSFGLSGCRADRGSIASSQMGENPGSAVRTSGRPHSAFPDQPDPTTSTDPAKRPLLVCFGDSLTAGYGADDGASYPDFLQKDLDRDGFHYRVVNEGISGNTTKDGLDRIQGIVAMKPEVVVLEFGGNDGLRGFKVPTTRTNLAAMIVTLQKAGIKVVVAGITLPPDYGKDYVNAFTANYATLARQYNTPILPFLLQNVYGVDGLMQNDNIHATDQGNEVVARNVQAVVEPILHK